MGAFLLAFEPIIVVVHILMALFLVGTILLQSGKGTDIGAAFGAGGSQSLFGSGGATTILTKITVGVAMMFLLTSLSLAATAKYSATGGGASMIADELAEDSNKAVTPTENKKPGINQAVEDNEGVTEK
jgi:preprotein translocase subunit SecG